MSGVDHLPIRSPWSSQVIVIPTRTGVGVYLNPVQLGFRELWPV